MFANQSHSKIETVAHEDSKHHHHKDFHKSIRIAKGLFASFLLFTICWLPYGLIVMSDYNDRFPRAAHMYSMMFAHLNSALNPLLYAFFNPAFQRGYISFFKMIIHGKNSKRLRNTMEHTMEHSLHISTIETKA
jgi:hypothetical protein